MINQITVFLENDRGRLASLCRCLADAGINMSALSIADTTDYGLVRIICNEAEDAKAALDKAGYTSTITKVAAIGVPNRPGGLAELLETLDDADIDIEYGYCFSHQDGNAVFALKVADPGKAASAVFKLEQAGFKVMSQGELD
ncbi:MAG: ACT domain-containing protein [Tractidigestivibacter sp.]|jgi:hypothetical protein|uniref:ACT domain-containing protein n=1 Tax=Tractidigestivibacter sp. TaxID=2847320 RepID=UPI003D8D572F